MGFGFLFFPFQAYGVPVLPFVNTILYSYRVMVFCSSHHCHMGKWVSCSSLRFSLWIALAYSLRYQSMAFFLPFFSFFFKGTWVSGILFFPSQVYGLSLLYFMTFLPHTGSWLFCSSLHSHLAFLFIPSQYHCFTWDSCSSLQFYKGYWLSVLPFKFSYRVMCFLFFPSHFYIGSCIFCSPLSAFI